MRARLFMAGLITTALACSTPGADPGADPALDEPGAAPELALNSPTGTVPVASEVEMRRLEPAVLETPIPAPVRPDEERVPEPIGTLREQRAAPEPAAVATSGVQSDADGLDEVAGDAAEGGGKPSGVSTGLGPVSDRNWGDPVIIDNPNPVPGLLGQDGGVITRGGPGGMHDDCKKHPRGGSVAVGGSGAGPAVLVNDRDPRRGAAINERAPRTTNRPSLPRGGGFPRGGIR